MQAQVASMVLEGVFERYPRVHVVLVEGGFAWGPSLGWRLDRLWSRMRDEVPHAKRPPSEYMRQNLYFTTQPMEEPEQPDDLLLTFEQIGWDRVVFSTDYPHWDFDDPRHAFKVHRCRRRFQAACCSRQRGETLRVEIQPGFLERSQVELAQRPAWRRSFRAER